MSEPTPMFEPGERVRHRVTGERLEIYKVLEDTAEALCWESPSRAAEVHVVYPLADLEPDAPASFRPEFGVPVSSTDAASPLMRQPRHTTFELGDVVTLRSGSIAMTVVRVGPDRVDCDWYNDRGGFASRGFPPAALVLLPE